jgi:tetratricopeptide (TPR) repeat protein
MKVSSTLDHLLSFLNEANLDDALKEVRSIKRDELLQQKDTTQFERTSLVCVYCEVLDYGGLYAEAKRTIDPFLKEAKHAVQAFATGEIPTVTLEQADLLHQLCYVLIHAGISIYRKANYNRSELEGAKKLFELSRDALERLEEAGFPHPGAISRAWYCVGLVYRELYEYADARAAFSRSIEVGAMPLMGEQQRASYRYALSKSYGLGNAWISYTEASLAESQCHVVAARLLLRGAKAVYIRAYIELVNGMILLSARSDEAAIKQAIDILEKAYKDLGGDNAVKSLGTGHGPYAIRTANELAAAYLRYAQVPTAAKNRTGHLETALSYARRVRTSDHAEFDKRTRCKTHILESRIQREKGNLAEALHSAEAALADGGSLEFSRVDCWLTLGEAKYYMNDYPGAIEAFDKALEFGHTNRKVFAVCHLHLSRTYLKNNEPSKASAHFNTWKDTRRALENAFVRGLVSEVTKSLEAMTKDFTINENDPELNADVHIKALRRWLANAALRASNDNYKKAAQTLGVQAEATIRNWLK